MKKYHNDEKVMREVKFIPGRNSYQRMKSPVENLRIGGTDHQKRNLKSKNS